jgi:hypothetical protein
MANLPQYRIDQVKQHALEIRQLTDILDGVRMMLKDTSAALVAGADVPPAAGDLRKTVIKGRQLLELIALRLDGIEQAGGLQEVGEREAVI